ncbi:MAG TPA: pyruvoyl-dependent arginine decarboxylase [Acidimicrobiales bacterium]|nr:pyruvoyl-dependent arginine decarboxylase [Acidimicrobiales bacterium]
MRAPIPESVIDLTGTGAVTTRLITVRSAIGHGPTALAAFDRALQLTGIHNFNLIVLSSVIPARTEVRVDPSPEPERTPGDWGDRLYVVMAEHRATVAGETAAAGIGWVQQDDNGRGLFVEHSGSSAERVRADLGATMSAMTESRGGGFGPLRTLVTETTCTGEEAACALVVAIYGSESWKQILRG